MQPNACKTEHLYGHGEICALCFLELCAPWCVRAQSSGGLSGT